VLKSSEKISEMILLFGGKTFSVHKNRVHFGFAEIKNFPRPDAYKRKIVFFLQICPAK
jgi:hypothetical protein